MTDEELKDLLKELSLPIFEKVVKIEDSLVKRIAKLERKLEIIENKMRNSAMELLEDDELIYYKEVTND